MKFSARDANGLGRAKYQLSLQRLEQRLLLSGVGGAADDAAPEWDYTDEGSPCVPGEVLVGYRGSSGLAAAGIASGLQSAQVTATFESIDVALVRLPDGMSVKSGVEYFSSLPGVQYAEPNYTRTLSALFPDDPLFDELYGLHNTGQTGGIADADIDAPEAWDITTGSASVVVGVLDTGVDFTHPDLVNQAWVNPGEIAGNGIDDDGNGYIDDINGWDFYDNDNDPSDTSDPLNVSYGHGTHVAGTIAADSNNGQGVAGVAWDVKIAALRIFHNNTTTSAAIVGAIQYATMMGFPLTNNSWGGGPGSFSMAEMNAIDAAGAANQLFIAAAGNDSTNNDIFPQYPASYDLDNIISVAASTSTDSLASFSNYGATTVDLAAPGQGILSTYPGGGYEYMNGTSMATPQVSGVAALLWSSSPGATYGEIRDALLDGVDPKAAFGGVTVTGGRLNAYNSLLELGIMVQSTTPAPGTVLTAPPTEFVVDFTQDYLPASIGLDDILVEGTAPSSFELLDGDSVAYRYTVSPVTTEGPQTLTVPAGAVQAFAGPSTNNLWTDVFYYDTLPLEVVATTPGEGTVGETVDGSIDLVVDFSEAFDAATVDAADLTVSAGSVSGVTVLDADTIEFTIAGLTSEGILDYSFDAGAFSDPEGNPLLPYDGTLVVDFGTAPFVTPMVGQGPRGGLVYVADADGNAYGTGDVDSFTIDLDAGGSTVAVVVDPWTGGVQYEVSLFAPGGIGPIASMVGDPGMPVTLPATPTALGGTYTVSVESLSGSGNYTAAFVLNAEVEQEMVFDAAVTNDDLGDAEPISHAFADLTSMSRAAVVGNFEWWWADLEDWYSVDFFGGEVVSVDLAGDSSLQVTLHDAGGAVVATGLASAIGRNIDRYEVPVGGTYYVSVQNPSGLDVEYTVLVSRNGVFNQEPNDSLGQEQSLTNVSGGAYGYIGVGPAMGVPVATETEPNDDGLNPDWFAMSAADMALANDISGDFVAVGGGFYESSLSAQLDSNQEDVFSFWAEPGQTLTCELSPITDFDFDPWLELYDSDGNWLAYDDDSGFDYFSMLSYTFSGSAASTYYLRVVPYGWTSVPSRNMGDYLMVTTLDSRPPGGDTDLYTIDVTEGEPIQLQTTVPGAGPDEFTNGLDPMINLYDPSGTLVISDDNGRDGLNALINYNVPLGQGGTWTVEVLAVDGSGDYVLETQLLSEPGQPNLLAAYDTGVSSTDNITMLDSLLTFTVPGTYVGASVFLYADSVLVGSALASSAVTQVTLNGGVNLAEGVREITATQTPVGGTESDPSPALNLTIDYTAPATPTVSPDLWAASDSGLYNDDDLTNDTTPTFAVAPTDTYFRFYESGVQVSGNYAGGTSYTSQPLADGATAFAYSGVDAAGNESGLSGSTVITVDTVAPGQPGAPDLDASTDTGFYSWDDFTNEQDLLINVGALADYFRLYRDGTAVSAPPTLGDDGSVYRTGSSELLSAQPFGAFRYTTTQVDAAGNESAHSDPLAVNVSPVVPIATHGYPDGVTVSLFDTDMTDGHSAPVIAWTKDAFVKGTTEVLVEYKGDGVVKGITLFGDGAGTSDLGFMIEGNAELQKFQDKRPGTPVLGFLISEGSVKKFDEHAGMGGANMNGFIGAEGWALPADIDGDGSIGDAIAFYTEGEAGNISTEGTLGADVVAVAGLGKFDLKDGPFTGDIVVPEGELGNVGIEGSMSGTIFGRDGIKKIQIAATTVSGTIRSEGLINNVKIKAAPNVPALASPSANGNFSGWLDALGGLKNLKMDGNMTGLLTSDDDVGNARIGGDLSHALVDVAVGGLKTLRVQGDVDESDICVAEELKNLKVGGGFQNSNADARILSRVNVSGEIGQTHKEGSLPHHIMAQEGVIRLRSRYARGFVDSSFTHNIGGVDVGVGGDAV